MLDRLVAPMTVRRRTNGPRTALRLVENLRQYGLALTVAAVCLVLVDYATGWQLKMSLLDHHPRTNPLTLLLMVMSLAALLMQRPNRPARKLELAVWMAVLCLVALTPISASFADAIAPDDWLGKTGGNTALAFGMLGLAQIALARIPGIASRILLLSVVPAIIALNGLVLGSPHFHGEMALTTALGFTGLWMASLRRLARRHPVRLFLAENRAGRLLRLQIALWLVADIAMLLGLRLFDLHGASFYPLIHSGQMLLTWVMSFWFSVKFADLLSEAGQRHTALRDEADRDHLTQLATRRAAKRFYDDIAQEGQSHCVLLIDIDHFKQINDRLGHPTGDEALKWLAECVRNTLRISDFSARWGGEEFLVILNRAPAISGVVWAERLRTTLAIGNRPSDIPDFTVSIGVTAPGANDGMTLDQLVERADQALYAAKEDGRNCAWFADPDLDFATRRTSPRPRSSAVAIRA